MLTLKMTTLLLISLFAFYYGYTKEQMIRVSGKISERIHADEVTFIYWDEVFSETLLSFTPEHKITVPVRDGYFDFEMQIDRPWVYMGFAWNYDLSGSPNYSHTYLYIAEANDDVFVKIDSSEGRYILNFQGNGAAKYNAISNISLNSTLLSTSWHKENNKKYDANNFKEFQIERGLKAKKYLTEEQLKVLGKYKAKVNNNIYDQYQINIFAAQYRNMCIGLSNTLSQKNVSYDEVWVAVNQAVLEIQKITSQFEKQLNPQVLSNSPQYIDFKRSLAMLNARLHNIPLEVVLSAPEQPDIMDKCLTSYIIAGSTRIEPHRRDSILQFADNVLQNPFCIQMLKKFTDRSRISQNVNDFSLPDIDDKIVNLSDFRGKIVFVDFWYAGCGACSAYYQEVLKEVEEKYRESKDVVFITISIDKDKRRWLKGIESGSYTSSEVINLRCPEGINTPVIQHFAVMSFPRPLLIDRDGKIFSTSETELRFKGVNGLIAMIERAKKH